MHYIICILPENTGPHCYYKIIGGGAGARPGRPPPPHPVVRLLLSKRYSWLSSKNHKPSLGLLSSNFYHFFRTLNFEVCTSFYFKVRQKLFQRGKLFQS